MKSRREFLASGVALATVLQLQRSAWAQGVAAETVCQLTAEQEVGPYYVADEMVRRDIREGRAGIPLLLRLAVLDSRTCTSLANAAVDVWHCDAMGLYSGYTKQSLGGSGGPGGPPPDGFGPPPVGFGPPPDGAGGPPPGGFGGPPPENKPSDKLTFLRGIQHSDAKGVVEFQTVFPGYYMGRVNHIHFKVRLGGANAGKTYKGGHTSHIGQVFFPEETAAELMKHPPYSAHAIHRTTMAEDFVFNDEHGGASISKLIPLTDKGWSGGMRAELVAAVDPTATPAPVRGGGPPPRG